jgi:hypothetical protein
MSCVLWAPAPPCSSDGSRLPMFERSSVMLAAIAQRAVQVA